MKIRSLLVLTTALAIGAMAQGFGGPGFGGPGRGRFGGPVPMFGFGPPVADAPFSAQAVATVNRTLANGTQVNHSTTASIARDAQGRTWVQTTETAGRRGSRQPADQGATQTVIHITDPVAHMAYTVYPAQQLALSHPLPQRPARNPNRAQSPRQRPQGTPLDPITIDGIAATGASFTRTTPAGVVTRETWYSDQLHVIVKSSSNDPRMGQRSFTLQNISTQPPDPSLFTVPSGYTVKAGAARGRGGRG